MTLSYKPLHYQYISFYIIIYVFLPCVKSIHVFPTAGIFTPGSTLLGIQFSHHWYLKIHLLTLLCSLTQHTSQPFHVATSLWVPMSLLLSFQQHILLPPHPYNTLLFFISIYFLFIYLCFEWLFLDFPTLKLKAQCSFRMLGTTQPKTQHHIPEELSLHKHYCEKLKSCRTWNSVKLSCLIHGMILSCVRFEVLTAVIVKTVPFSLVDGDPSFMGICYLHP